MINKKKILLNTLWFLIGMAVAVFPVLLFEKCSEVRKPETRETPGRKQGAVDHPGNKQTICGNPMIARHAV